ncbi:hypothetical protein E3T35_14595 [Cryobacterium sp. TMT1-2-2]|uniref:hypothetical protein n=1 Tax=Cryobacterium sp. TMT1-2-2 TaxID=1259233 RepID=UPI00106C9517|nr:hypothetical protein [Cryobacterium sp. TMT1-2-2]TFD09700.1 hypothetical protein E3T35_14595 [Cryobacterium sp. TMT1-2-2]
MSNKIARRLIPVASALFVVAFFLFAALWVNGNFPVPIALSIAIVFGTGTYLAMAKGSSGKA